MENDIESTAEINITVDMFPGGRAEVRMKTKGAEFIHLVNATKYMMWMVAKHTGAELEESLRLLCEGARNFKGVSLSVAPLLSIVPDKKE